jgi:hypothetical protein
MRCLYLDAATGVRVVILEELYRSIGLLMGLERLSGIFSKIILVYKELKRSNVLEWVVALNDVFLQFQQNQLCVVLDLDLIS